MARQPLDAFLGFVLEYSINCSDYAHQKREAIYSTIEGAPPEGSDFSTVAGSMYDELDQLERQLREGVE